MIGSKRKTEFVGRVLWTRRSESVEARVEAARASGGGLASSDYADMSNEKPGGNPGRRNPKASRGRFVRPGSVGT